MTDAELQALTALVQHWAAHVRAQTEQYGQLMYRPDRRPAAALAAELERRGILPVEPEPTPDSDDIPY